MTDSSIDWTELGAIVNLKMLNDRLEIQVISL